ncbi:putative transcription factor/ chromatin remodeling BED-type(Zn) family [Helianthus debilis subsp. tardiflorus]
MKPATATAIAIVARRTLTKIVLPSICSFLKRRCYCYMKMVIWFYSWGHNNDMESALGVTIMKWNQPWGVRTTSKHIQTQKNNMATEEGVVLILETKRNPAIWKYFDLCLMSDNYEMARCKNCGKFMKAAANSTLKKHTDKHCPVTKAKKEEKGEGSGSSNV